jgi:hypothetical protein
MCRLILNEKNLIIVLRVDLMSLLVFVITVEMNFKGLQTFCPDFITLHGFMSSVLQILSRRLNLLYLYKIKRIEKNVTFV